jgi:nitrite reductase/ring-hydroxylating ferredoxin subunit
MPNDGAPRRAVLLSTDALVCRRLAALGEEADLVWVGADSADPIALVVLDLDRPDALDQVREWRTHRPGAWLVGHLGTPDPDRWLAAQRAGCDLVANRGALTARVRHLLSQSEAAAHRYPVLPEADLAGRLGLVAAVDAGPARPVAVYQVAGAVAVVANRCPHAGARLSDGELAGTVLTCPGHGSQFDVTTGERVRGPADCDLLTYKVRIERGQLTIVVGPVVDPTG